MEKSLQLSSLPWFFGPAACGLPFGLVSWGRTLRACASFGAPSVGLLSVLVPLGRVEDRVQPCVGRAGHDNVEVNPSTWVDLVIKREKAIPAREHGAARVDERSEADCCEHVLCVVLPELTVRHGRDLELDVLGVGVEIGLAGDLDPLDRELTCKLDGGLVIGRCGDRAGMHLSGLHRAGGEASERLRNEGASEREGGASEARKRKNKELLLLCSVNNCNNSPKPQKEN